MTKTRSLDNFDGPRRTTASSPYKDVAQVLATVRARVGRLLARRQPLRPLLDCGPVAAQHGAGQRAIAVLPLAFAPVKRALPGVRWGPAGETACRPPASHREGAEGAAFIRPMR